LKVNLFVSNVGKVRIRLFINCGVTENVDGFVDDWLGNQPKPSASQN